MTTPLRTTGLPGLELNEIGVRTLALSAPIPLDTYRVNRDTGGFTPSITPAG